MNIDIAVETLLFDVHTIDFGQSGKAVAEIENGEFFVTREFTQTVGDGVEYLFKPATIMFNESVRQYRFLFVASHPHPPVLSRKERRV
ncbi:hypothetical protein [Gordonibacter sp.]|uniref:hypothetical protein n=1 Tax=Gordonibacter sp. TaxID=1968902 RepID=UPI0025B7F6D6|nr:hypothetical protein [Gordonibacter sp.]